MYIIFYSKYCNFSNQFLTTLEKTRENQFFKRVSVDTPQGRNFAVTKYNVKKVPTIIVDETPLVGVEALKWLQKKIKTGSVGSLSTRNNKTPINNLPQVTGFTPDLNNESFGGAGNVNGSMYSSVYAHQNIVTPVENDDMVEKTKFILPGDTITEGFQIPTSANKGSDKMSQFDREYENMKKSRGM